MIPSFSFFIFVKSRHDGFMVFTLLLKQLKRLRKGHCLHSISNNHSEMAFKVTYRKTSFHLENYSQFI